MDLRDASLGFYRVWFAATGTRHRLLRPEWASLDTLARGYDAEIVARYLRGAEALGLVERKGERVRLRPEHRATLATPESSDDLSRHFRYLSQKSLGFGALDDLLAGKPPDADLSDVYAIATGWDHVAFFERVLPRERALRATLSKGADVLDLGAGLGAWTRELRARFPRARVTMADVAPRGEAIRVEDVPDGAFDVVYCGEVLAAAEDPARVLATATRALRPGGAFHALEGLLPRAGSRARGWGPKLIQAMDLDFALDGSRFLGIDEAERLLRDARLVDRRVRDVGGSLYHLRGRARSRPRA